MRDIKFRGKTINEEKYGNGKDGWIYGNLSVLKNEIISIQDTSDSNLWKRVSLETVGQYTGLKDKNGREIYEKDIVKVKHNNCIYIGIVKYDEEHCEYRIELVDAYINLWKKLDLEVIGNIYDNKELLEE